MKSIITGVAGQDGSYLAELLLSSGHTIVGVDKRRVGLRPNMETFKDNPNFRLVEGDITDASFITRLIINEQPDYFYNLAAMSHVGQSFQEPGRTAEIDGVAIVYQLEAIRSFSPHTRYYQASTSELFSGLNCPETGYDESSLLRPRSPYGSAKLFAYSTVKNYREAYDIKACTAFLFNHEGPRRGPDFVTRKITLGIADIVKGKSSYLTLGNLDAHRDWGHAKDYVKAMKLIIESGTNEDYVVATGETHSIKDFLSLAFHYAGVDNWSGYVKLDPRFLRPSEVPYLLGNSTKIRTELGWVPDYTFDKLVREMVEHDLRN